MKAHFDVQLCFLIVFVPAAMSFQTPQEADNANPLLFKGGKGLSVKCDWTKKIKNLRMEAYPLNETGTPDAQCQVSPHSNSFIFKGPTVYIIGPKSLAELFDVQSSPRTQILANGVDAAYCETVQDSDTGELLNVAYLFKDRLVAKFERPATEGGSVQFKLAGYSGNLPIFVDTVFAYKCSSATRDIIVTYRSQWHRFNDQWSTNNSPVIERGGYISEKFFLNTDDEKYFAKDLDFAGNSP